MPANEILYGGGVLTVTTSTVLGYGPGQVTPPHELVLNPAGPITITLPPINSVLPAPPTTAQTITGVGRKFTITLRQNTTQAITLLPFTNATVTETISDAPVLTAVGSVQTYIASPDNGTWYKVSN